MNKIKLQLSIIFLLFTILAGSANAACYADYKARKYNPFKLHYGVLLLYTENCVDETASVTKSRVYFRLEQVGWRLLNVIDVFNDSGLNERKEIAGEYYLKF